MKKLKIIIPVLVIALIATYFGYNTYSNRIRYNDTYVNGNTSGNLYNAGLFCESDGLVFFANPDDNNRLYSMDVSGGNLKKLCDDTVMYINADSNYVYYVKNNEVKSTDFYFFSYNHNSLCRISRKGGTATVLDGDPCIYASLIGNYIYYLHYDTETATTLYKIKIDGKEQTQLSDTYSFTCNTFGQYFYFNGPNDGKLYQYDTATDQQTLLLDCNCYKPIVINGENAYYLDVSNDNALVHTNISSNTPTTLSEDFIELYNVYGSYVYYQKGGDDAALCMIKNDGTDYKELVAGEYTNINVTSYYIYFTDFFSKTVYYTPTSNPGTITPFHPGVVED